MSSRRPKRRSIRAFRPSLLAVGPAMLLVGLVVSVGAHVALGVVLYDKSMGRIPEDAFEHDRLPVRVKRATFDQLRRADAAGDSAASREVTRETTDTLADRLLDAVDQAQDFSDNPFDPALELRSVPEPLPHFEAPSVNAADPAFDDVMAGLIPEPEAPVYEMAVDSGAGLVPNAQDRTSDLLTQITSADAPLSAGHGAMGGGPAGAFAAAGAGATGRGLGRLGAGHGGHGGQVSGAVGAGEMGGAGGANDLGLDFLGFGDIAPDLEGFGEPPERLDEDFAYDVARFAEPGGAGGHFRVRVTGRRSLRKLATMPKEVVFMVDTSRSINQKMVDAIAQGIGNGLGAMNPDDRFNVVLFSDQVRFFQKQPVAVNADSLRVVKKWLTGARSRGFTDVNLALRQLLKRDVEPGRVYELIMISDGKPTLGVLDTRELINLITRENDLVASIYCVGVGFDQDNRLLDFLAYRNKGFSVAVPNRLNIATEITALMSRLRYPIVTDVEVRFAGAGMSEVYPLRLPNVHQGEQFEVYGRYEKPGPFTMQITGRSAGRPVDLTFRAELDNAKAGGREVARDWGFWKLHHLYSEIIRVGPKTELIGQVRGLKEEYGLETLY